MTAKKYAAPKRIYFYIVDNEDTVDDLYTFSSMDELLDSTRDLGIDEMKTVKVYTYDLVEVGGIQMSYKKEGKE